ncbi:unnamed protein product [Miscanthus lutarioriparius]|uniref:Carboxypeptidase n=1 Tax=Miscanthus lutarioriparius TaxID=422564 RepID=A0A811ML11_9POAL|nr:unnamed protein product [Miscanthus lutarioriparius]
MKEANREEDEGEKDLLGIEVTKNGKGNLINLGNEDGRTVDAGVRPRQEEGSAPGKRAHAKEEGASGVGLGNFLEMGPLDVDLKPRNSTWLQKADLIFVDNPVGTGYSYVEDDSLFVTSDWQQAADMTTVVRALVKEVPTLATSPLFLVAESYGGKYAATLGASVARAVRAGELNITLGGVALGDSWISPEDFTVRLAISRVCGQIANEWTAQLIKVRSGWCSSPTRRCS